jgi:hypothetical protein
LPIEHLLFLLPCQAGSKSFLEPQSDFGTVITAPIQRHRNHFERLAPRYQSPASGISRIKLVANIAISSAIDIKRPMIADIAAIDVAS